MPRFWSASESRMARMFPDVWREIPLCPVRPVRPTASDPAESGRVRSPKSQLGVVGGWFDWWILKFDDWGEGLMIGVWHLFQTGFCSCRKPWPSETWPSPRTAVGTSFNCRRDIPGLWPGELHTGDLHLQRSGLCAAVCDLLSRLVRCVLDVLDAGFWLWLSGNVAM